MSSQGHSRKLCCLSPNYLSICVNEWRDSFSINSVGEQKGEKSKGWGLTFHFVETAKEKFSSFWYPSDKRPILWNKRLSTAGSHTLSLGLHTDPLTLARHRWEDRNSKETCDWNANSTQTYPDVLRRKLLASRASKRTKEGLCPGFSIYHTDI